MQLDDRHDALPSNRRRVSLRSSCTSILVLLAACSSPDLSGPPTTDLTQLPWTLDLSAYAITMDTLPPYNTLQLTASAQTVDGTPLPSTAVVTFTSSDSSVRVSSTGLLTARAARNGVKVAASVVYQGVRLTDTAIVNVTTVLVPPPFQQLQLQFPVGDSAKIPAPTTYSGFYTGDTKTLQFGALDGTGAKIDNSIVALRISDQLKAIWPGVPSAILTSTSNAATLQIGHFILPGTVTVYASATVYGVTREDSLQITITPQILFIYTLVGSTAGGSAAPGLSLQPGHDEVIGVGGYVWWYNSTANDSLDIVFDDPTAATADDAAFPSGGGNIPLFSGGIWFEVPDPSLVIYSRQFLQAGTYHWHSPHTGFFGTIVVQ